MKKLTALFLAVLLTFSGCAATPGESAPITRETAAEETAPSLPPDCADAAAEFGLNLLRRTYTREKNTLVSPLSVLAALGMTTNGAAGETRNQLEQTLGVPTRQLNPWIRDWLEVSGEQLQLANSLWIREDAGLELEETFLQTCTDAYRADVFEVPFDHAALEAINGWVSRKTQGKIPRMLDRVPSDGILYLINALSFDGDWETPYVPRQISEGLFTAESGAEQAVWFMGSTENLYLEDGGAVGFLKYYEGRDYAFAVLLPPEGEALQDYLTTLTGASLRALLENPSEAEVKASLPKFETEYDAELSDTLKAMGITDAFDREKADFSALGTCPGGDPYIGRVLHKTAITVGEEGTTAAASTVVEMLMGSAFRPDRKFVTLNRPFLYMLIDCRNNVPFFLGTVTDLSDNPHAPVVPETVPQLPSQPPRLQLAGDPDAAFSPGSFDWTVQNGDITDTLLACGPAPMDYAGREPMLTAAPGEIFLVWETESGEELPPDSVQAQLLNPETGEENLLQATAETLHLPGTAGILHITARWEGIGAAEYILTYTPMA